MKVEKWNVAGEDAKCPFGVSTSEILLVGDMHVFLCNLLTIAQTKVSCLEAEKVKLNKKLIGLQFNMDDRKVAAIEA
jgi:hypothetical protein